MNVTTNLQAMGLDAAREAMAQAAARASKQAPGPVGSTPDVILQLSAAAQQLANVPKG